MISEYHKLVCCGSHTSSQCSSCKSAISGKNTNSVVLCPTLASKIAQHCTTNTCNCTAIDALDVTSYTALDGFPDVLFPSHFNCSLLHWDTSSVTSFRYTFRGVSSFNKPVRFDTSSVTDMYAMFYGLEDFNQPVNFDTSKVTNMSYMFGRTSAFNQPVYFDTSSVITMDYMFETASSFNQPVNFDTSSVSKITGMFHSVTNPQFDFTTSVDIEDIFIL